MPIGKQEQNQSSIVLRSIGNYYYCMNIRVSVCMKSVYCHHTHTFIIICINSIVLIRSSQYFKYEHWKWAEIGVWK